MTEHVSPGSDESASPSGHRAPIAVTGATGRIGSRVAARLAAAGRELRLVVRDAARAPQVPGASIGVAVASYGDAPACRSALTGVRLALMVSAAESADRVAEHCSFVDAAVAAGVEHIVYTSFLGADPDATFLLARDHWATEEHIRSCGARFTFLRDALYADLLPHLAGEDGAIRGPAGDGRVSFVAIDDLADAATAVLLDPDVHVGRTYDLTGPHALTLAEATSIATAATGRALRYEPETMDEARRSRAVYGAPEWMVDAWISTYTAIAAGEMATVSSHVTELTGRPATPLADVLRTG